MRGTYKIIHNDSCTNDGEIYSINAPIVSIEVYSSLTNLPMSVYSVNYKLKYYEELDIAPKKNTTLTFINASKTQQNETEYAHNLAVNALKNIIEHSDNKFYYYFGDYTYLSLNDKNYSDLFCSKNASFRSELISKYDAIYKFLAKGVEYIFEDQACSSQVYGFVYPANNDNLIYLCEQYDKSNLSPNKNNPIDTKIGTIIHEASHKAASTKDHFYSLQTCKLYAKACSLKNVENADCIEYYAELNHLDTIINQLQSDYDIAIKSYSIGACVGLMGYFVANY